MFWLVATILEKPGKLVHYTSQDVGEDTCKHNVQ